MPEQERDKARPSDRDRERERERDRDRHGPDRRGGDRYASCTCMQREPGSAW